MTNPTIDALIQQGVDYSTAQDKAFMAHDQIGEARASEGYEATVKALALVADVDVAQANEMILTAT